jgi:hypothetical protein
MNARFNHPLWTHLPVVAALAALIGAIVSAMPLPSPSPIHFGIDGQPDGFGSPWPGLLTIVGICALVVGIGISNAEEWSRRETKKSFHYWSLFDDLFVGIMSGIGIAYVRFISAAGDTFLFPWATVALVASATVGAAVILEIVRPFRQYEGTSTTSSTADISVLSKSVRSRIEQGAPIAYWDVQNPWWNRIVSIAIPVAVTAQVVIDYVRTGQFEVTPLAVGVLIIVLLLGGMRTTVDRQYVTVRFGTPGFRALRVAVSDVDAVVLRPFVPLGEFHGYGIRYNGYMKGVFLRGGVGVELTTHAGKHYLVGSDHPERLAAVIEAVSSPSAGARAKAEKARASR